MPGPVRVLIVEDHQLLAEAIESALKARGIEVQGTASSGREALALARRCEPDVILLDIGLPDADGVDVGKRILQACPNVRILVLTGLEGGDLVAEVLRAGFHGFLDKQAGTSELIEAIDLVAKGKAVLPHEVARAMAGSTPGRAGGAGPRTYGLTAREREVLAFLAGGADTAAIAEALFLSRNTIRTHIGNILGKLAVHSRVEAAAFAVRHRIVEPRRRRNEAGGATSGGYGDRRTPKMRRSG
jgi:DNA-binding NarL/FixJ family response regulator